MTRTQLITLLRSTAASQETLHHVMHVWPITTLPIAPPSLQFLFESACKAIGIHPMQAIRENRSRANVRARFLFSYYCQEVYSDFYTLVEIGKFLNGRNHTTIVHGRDTFGDLLETGDRISLLDLANMHRVLAGEEPVYPAKEAKMPKKQKFVRVFYERKTDRYYQSIKSIRSFYGFGKTVYINRSRFVQRVIPMEIMSEIDLF